MTRLVDADKLVWSIPPEENIARCIVANAPTVDAIPVEWIKKLIEEDRECAEKAKAEKNEKVFHFHKRLEICISQMLFDWEFENGKYGEFRSEEWQD